MPKISAMENRIRIRVGNWWKMHDKDPGRFSDWKVRVVGGLEKGYKITVNIEGVGRVTYGWDFYKGKGGLAKKGRTLYVHNAKMLEIIRGLEANGELRDYEIVDRASK